MARPLRLEFESAPYHASACGRLEFSDSLEEKNFPSQASVLIFGISVPMGSSL